jgi:hypothetical protein
MISVNISGTEEFKRAMLSLSDDGLKYAASVALNNLAYGAAMAERTEIKTVFDRPTPFVQRAPRYKKATKNSLEARVSIPDKSGISLTSEITGGKRRAKTYENVMRAAGVLGGGMYVVPGSGARLDRYGNVARAQLEEILTALGQIAPGKFTAKKAARRTKAAGDYFVGGVGRAAHLKSGIWKRTNGGRRVTPILLFVTGAYYRTRLAFYNVGSRYVAENAARAITKSVGIAIDKAGG